MCGRQAIKLALNSAEVADRTPIPDITEQLGFLLDARRAVLRSRVVAEKLLDLARITAGFFPQGLEHARHRHRIVPGLGQHLGPDHVRLFFGRPAELQKQSVQAKTADRTHDLSRRAVAQQPAEHAKARLGQVRLGCLVSAVAQGNVGHFMRHDTGQFSLVVSGVDQAPVHVHEPAWKSERVDIGNVHYLELVGKLGAGSHARQPLANPTDVILNCAVAQDRQLILNLGCRLLADLNVLLGTEKVKTRADFCLSYELARRKWKQ